MNDLLDREEYVYSVSNIEDKRSFYNPGEVVVCSW